MIRPITAISFVLLFTLLAVGQANIRAIDFKNFTYPAYCADDKPNPVEVKHGDFEHRGNESAMDYFHFWVKSVEFGDLDGDGKDEAVVITVCHPGGTGKFSEGYIFSLQRNKPKLIGRFPGGDRADGGLVAASVENGFLNVERNELSGGLCCPNFTVTQTYRFSKGNFTSVGDSVRKELYPPKRIVLPPSQNEVVFTETIDYVQRYVISAATGQILTVSTNLPNAPVSLYRGGELIDDGMNGLKAQFRPDEDIIFGIYNNGGQPRVFEVRLRLEEPKTTKNEKGFFTDKTNSLFLASLFRHEDYFYCPFCGGSDL